MAGPLVAGRDRALAYVGTQGHRSLGDPNQYGVEFGCVSVIDNFGYARVLALRRRSVVPEAWCGSDFAVSRILPTRERHDTVAVYSVYRPERVAHCIPTPNNNKKKKTSSCLRDNAARV